jgi:hypothetical protein
MQQRQELLIMTDVYTNNPISSAALAAIEEVIQKNEGGWKLTANKDDPDGGWTYGGCTKKLLASKYAIWNTVSFEEMQDFCGQVSSDTRNKDLIRRVYYEEFLCSSSEKIRLLRCYNAVLCCKLRCTNSD